MRREWRGLALALLLLAPPAGANEVMRLLPPGIRSAEERAGLAFTRSGASDGGGSRPVLVEVIPAGPAWVEVEYSVDPELESRVRRLLAEGGVSLGHVVVLDPATGEVFAYVSTDPDAFPATGSYPTASLMKVVTAAAVLRNAPEVADEPCVYTGSPYELTAAGLAPPEEGLPSSFSRAIAISNNQCFARFAVRDLGERALFEEMVRTGLFDPPAPRHAPVRVEPLEDELDLGELGSGLAGSFISPLSAARLAALLARGELVLPWWIARVRDATGDELPVPRPEARPVWAPELAASLRERMVGVTREGTARSAFRDAAGQPLLGPVQVSGKTGTLSAVRQWRFSPPTHRGRPTAATARLPIPVRVE